MKKKLFLALLPAVLVLSACNGGAQKEKVNNENDFLEDTLAHDEIFGKAEEGLAPKRAFGGQNPGTLRFEGSELDPELNPESAYEHPTIGVQSFYDDGGTIDDESDDTISFRFVATVTFSSDDAREASNAKWFRTVSKVDGTSYPLDQEVKEAPECKTAYKALSNGGTPYTIQQYNSEHTKYGDPTGYSHFVVYTLRNISLANYSGENYYVSAYLQMTGTIANGEPAIYSKAIAVRFDRAKKYVYVHNVGTAFMEGTIGGKQIYREATTVGSAYGDDVASFEGLELSTSDKVVIKEFDGTKLKIRNTSSFSGDYNRSSYYLSNDNGKMKPNFAGTYDLYLNSSHQIYTDGQDVVRPIYVSLDENASWWHNGDNKDENAWTAVYAYGASGSHWYKTTQDGDYLVTSAPINPSVYTTVIVVRMSYASRNKAEADLGWGDKYHNQTIDMPIKNSDTLPDKRDNYQDCVYLKDAQEGNNKKAEWGGRA